MVIGMYRNEYEKEMVAPHCEEMIYIGPQPRLKKVDKEIKAENTYLFLNIYSLGPSIVKVTDFLNLIKNRGAKYEFLDNVDIDDIDVEEFFNKAAVICSKIASYKSLEALSRAREKGIIGGRPAISEETIDRIKNMHAQKFTMRQISQECNVSLGTVYKYCREADAEFDANQN